MVTELSFLLELLLEHKLGKDTRSAVAERIKHVESQYAIAAVSKVPSNQADPAARNSVQPRAQVSVPPEALALAASLAAEAGAEPPVSTARISRRAPVAEPIPAQAVGVSDAARVAIRQRNELIAAASKGISKPGAPIGRGHGTK